MKAIYENDPARGPGYGFFRLEDLPAADRSGAAFSLIRSGDQKSLHPGGWEDTECRLAPDAVHAEGNALLLAIGPDVVGRLDELNTYRLVFFPAVGSPQKAVLQLSGVVYPPQGQANVINAARPLSPPPPQVEPQPVPEEPLPPPPLVMPEPAPVPEPAPRRFPSWLIALLVLVMAAWALFFFRDKLFPTTVIDPPGLTEPVDEPVDETGNEQDAPEPGEEPDPDEPALEPDQAAGPTEPEAAETALSPLDRARHFLRSNGSADEALGISRELPSTPEGRDAAFLLLEYAAEQSQTEAMFALAAFYDPALDHERGSIMADAEQAWLWYDRARAAGMAEAGERQEDLRAWLEREASAGSATARDILLRLP